MTVSPFLETEIENIIVTAVGKEWVTKNREGSCCIAQAGLELLVSSDFPCLSFESSWAHR